MTHYHVTIFKHVFSPESECLDKIMQALIRVSVMMSHVAIGESSNELAKQNLCRLLN